MRTALVIPLIFIATACITQVEKIPPSIEVLNIYRQQTARTDPGEYAYLYDGLPERLEDLNSLIKKQLIHPVEAREMNVGIERFEEDNLNHTVAEMLAQLVMKGNAGLTMNRKSEDRLILACYHHSMLLTSILRSRGIPVRMRAGYARYYEKAYGVRFGHVICEVWDETDKRWMLVDPDREKVDFSPGEFDFAPQAYLNLRNNEIDPGKYTSTLGKGLRGAIHLLSLDLSFLLHEEKMNWQLPEIVMKDFSDYQELDEESIQVMDKLVGLSQDPDANLDSIRQIYTTHPFIQPSSISYDKWLEAVLN